MQSQVTTPRIDFSQLLRAAEGLTQWRPALLGFLTLLGCAVLAGAGQFLAMRLGGAGGALLTLLVMLLTLVVAASGFSGAGALLMDRAKGLAPRSLVDALVFGLMCLPKFIGFALVLLGLTLGLTLVAAVVYFVCKVPGIGPLLLFVAHPVLVVVAGVFFTAVFWVVVPLFTPAVWDGRGFKEALSLVFTVARTRLVQVVALFLVLYVVIWVIGFLLFAALLPGYGFMTGLAGSILGLGSLGGMSSLMGLLSGYGSGSGHMYAGVLSSGLIFAVAITLMFQVLIMGVNLVYLAASSGVDVSASQNALEAGLAQARDKAREAQVRARDAAQRARQSAQQAVESARPSPAAPVAAAAARAGCPQCHEAVAPDDVFCGHCGHRLQ